jgi:hypothetical protein
MAAKFSTRQEQQIKNPRRFIEKAVATLPAFVIFRAPFPPKGKDKPLTENCSLYGWTTYSYSTEGL